VFRVRLSTAERPALPLPDKPSLAVLPFQNMSGDPEQEYFADGMVEEITTALSRIRSLFVIARNSAFTYKGKAVDIRQVGRELGVRYVLEGSVRKAGPRVRITGQLVEAATGMHLWADRFEGTLEDVFDLQDRMTASVVAAIEPNVRAAEIQRAQRKPAANLQAYDLLLRALPHLYGRTQAGSAEGVRLLQQAVAIDPSYALGLAYLAECQLKTIIRNLIDPDDPMVAEIVPLVQSALALDPNDPEVLAIAGDITARIGDLSGGMALLDRSLELNPNNAPALAAAAYLRANSGDAGAAISLLDRSARHNPLDWNYRLCSSYIITYFVAGEYERAVEWSAKALQEFPHSTVALRYRAACLGQLGRLEEGWEVVQHLLAVLPDFTITRYRRHLESNNVLRPGTIDALCEGLRRCGAPE
jgi:adenylate cyclase